MTGRSVTERVGESAGEWDWLAPLTAASLSFAVYARTLLPGIAFGDWGEMQTVPHVLGVAHPTGYPTYVLLAWFAELLPIGSVAWRSNLLSAVLVSAAVGVTVLILRRLGVGSVVAVAAALALAAVRTVWAAATVAEVNPLHLLFIALLLHRALAWEAERRPRDLILGALLLGLSLGNHLLTVFAVPCIAAFVLWTGRRALAERPWLVAAAAGAGLVGLSVYLYIPIAASLGPPLPYNHPVTPDAVLWLVTGRQFRDQFDFFAASGPQTLINALPSLWSLLAGRGSAVLPILGLAGLALLVRRRPAFGLTCAAILLTHVYIWANYLELEHYLLVPWLLLAIGAAVAVDSMARTVAGWLLGPRLRRGAIALTGAIALVLVARLAIANWDASDRSDERGGDAYVAAVMDALPQDAAILSIWDASTPLWHARFVLGERPDVLVVDDTNIVYEGWGTRENRIASLICERPVFILRLDDADLDATRQAYRLEPFLAVQIGQGGPTIAADREVYRVEPLEGSC
jgi:transmembrane protein TMEM260 (protein O-mannosyltransferase)